ncbi:MAG: membrane or secreted protein [Bacteroidota bacterium]
MATVLLTVIVLGLAFAGIATRILLVKDGQFAGTCSSNNPYLKNELGECTVCGKKVDEPCGADDLPAEDRRSYTAVLN